MLTYRSVREACHGTAHWRAASGATTVATNVHGYPLGYCGPVISDRRSVAAWPVRRWWVALLGAFVTVVSIAVPTAMIANPVFGRSVPVTAWAWPALLLAAALSGLLLATYVRDPVPADPDDPVSARTGVAGAALTFFAVGCPVCNKLVLVLLGTSGAMQWFAPVQPVLAVAAVGLLAWALRARLRGETACRVPTSV
jgi:hypothetical protein